MSASLSSKSLNALAQDLPQHPSLIDACEIATQFPGPCCVVADQGAIVAASPAGEALIQTIRQESAMGAPGPVLRLVRQTVLFNRPLGGRLTLPREDDPAAGPRSFDLVLLPCRRTAEDSCHVLLIAVETTLEHNLRKALIASRDLFRELVRCSSDLAWETDTNGLFTFVGGRGTLGYSADALHGRPAVSLVDLERSTAQGAESRSPFFATAPVEDVEVWLRGAGGDAHCFLISAVPILEADGHWRGARGIGREVTALRLREAELARARAREELSRAVVDAVLCEGNFKQMLGAAARALALTTKSDRSWVLCAEADGGYDVGAAFGMIPHGTRHFLPPSLALPVLNAQGLVTFEAEGWSYLGAPTVLRGALNGGICVARAPEAPEFDEETRALIELVARHTAVAIAQAGQLRALVDLSRSDEMTGLANRRGFQERYEHWLANATGPAARGALFYIDLDDFKGINDRAGHLAGDALLRTFANLLHRDSRKRDLSIRFGGDEFAVFLEGIGPEHVLPRAERLLRAAFDIPLPELAGGGNLRLSIGIATMKASDREPAEAVIDRADKALYDAKRAGKGQVALALSPTGRGENASC